MSIFLRTWCRKFTEEIFPEHVFLPKTNEDIAKAMGEYSILGLVGAICSMDVTHVRSRLISDPDFVAWRKRIESVRKDVERGFGILKGRWRILKLPMRLKTKG